MLQLNPGEQFPIVRVLKDHTDTATYYVQAVVRNASTDAVISTVNLTDRGNRRFSLAWDVPYFANDTYIVITSTVYDDSGYTTKSANYAEEADTYLIQQRWGLQFGGGGGGGSNVSYKRIEEIMREVLGGFKVDIPPVETLTQAQLTTVANEIVKRLSSKISDIKIPEQKPVDFSSITNSIAITLKEIKALPHTVTEIKPVLKSIDQLTEALHSAEESFDASVEGQTKKITDLIRVFEDFTTFLKNVGVRATLVAQSDPAPAAEQLSPLQRKRRMILNPNA